jgi:hypothetical protein
MAKQSTIEKIESDILDVFNEFDIRAWEILHPYNRNIYTARGHNCGL